MSLETYEFYVNNIDRLNELGKEGFHLDKLENSYAFFTKLNGKVEYFVFVSLPICGKFYSEQDKDYSYHGITKVVSLDGFANY